MDIKTFETKLRSIQWGELNHAYGDAGDVPDAVMALFDPKKKVREEALRHLRHSLNHQGFPENSAPVAVPILIDLLQVPSLPSRDKILSFLSEFSFGHRQTKLGHTEVMLPYDWKPGDVLVALYQEVYDEVCKGIPVYLSLLNDGEEAVRREALYLLAWLAPADLTPTLSILDGEGQTKSGEGWVRSEAETFGLSIALSLSYSLNKKKMKEPDREYLRQEMHSGSLLRRLGAAIGLCYAGEPATEEILSVLQEALSCIPWRRDIPWNNGNLADYVGLTLSWLRKSRGEGVAYIYQQELERKVKALTPRKINYSQMPGMWPYSLAQELLAIAFEEPLKASIKWPDGYTPLQRWLLRFLASHPSLGMSEGYCSVTEHLNRIGVPHPTKRREKLRLKNLEEIALLTGEEYPSVYEVLTQSIMVGFVKKRLSFFECWRRASRAAPRERRRWLVLLVESLSCSQLCTFVEELLAQPQRTHRLSPQDAETMRAFCALLRQKPGMLAAVRATARALSEGGCLRYPGPGHIVFMVFAQLLLGLSPNEAALGAGLLRGSPEFFEHQDAEELREVLLLLPAKERGEVIDAIHIRSFAEPDFAWSLYDLAPSQGRVKRLQKALGEDADFFAGPGAFALVRVLAAMPKEFLSSLVEELHLPRAARLGYAHLLAAGLAQHPARDELLPAFVLHKDVRVRWIASNQGRLSVRLLAELGIDGANKEYTRAKGGVIGANGKPWDGSMPRYKKKKAR